MRPLMENYILQLDWQHFLRMTAQIAERPTRPYTAVPAVLPAEKIASTRLKSKTPTRPQFRPPTTNKIQAIISNSLIGSPHCVPSIRAVGLLKNSLVCAFQHSMNWLKLSLHFLVCNAVAFVRPRQKHFLSVVSK